jgi:hypothetical protein
MKQSSMDGASVAHGSSPVADEIIANLLMELVVFSKMSVGSHAVSSPRLMERASVAVGSSPVANEIIAILTMESVVFNKMSAGPHVVSWGMRLHVAPADILPKPTSFVGKIAKVSLLMGDTVAGRTLLPMDEAVDRRHDPLRV